MSRKREHYRNGDPIVLPGGCDGCAPIVINGGLCHEAGCHEAWRDQPVSCFECGFTFFRTEGPHERVCPDCAAMIDLAASWGEDPDDEEDEP